MTQTISEVMTKNPVTMASSTPLSKVARAMRDSDIGDVIVMDGDRACGIVTDRDVTIRGIAAGLDPKAAKVGDICSKDPVCVSPGDDVEKAVSLMRDRAIRRLPVCDGGKPVGVVSLGDLARDRDHMSVLAGISAAPGNH